jgi:predicted RNase H-like nuclease (RuvC/YqgF family)
LKELLEKLQDVGEKADYLTQRSALLVQENRGLRNRVAELEETLGTKESEIKDLTSKLELAKLARGMEVGNSTQSEELKNKINEYIREIDQCLKLIGD